ncbi:MAG TPA: TonB-dependent receptor [Gemmatimonadaceae bacterium]|jgi:iron complex outermembrane receptor protein
MKRRLPAAIATSVALVASSAALLGAQVATPPAKPDSAVTLGTVKVTAATADETHVTVLERLTLPATIGITAKKVQETVNIMDTEDAVKYLPSIFLRKRNYGDTQATMATRVWGVSSSARSLIFADDVPITALIANNNTIGGPRWGMISPEEIARIDVMYGPFSAAYAGNSMGAVMEITTRQPDSLQVTVEQSQALQKFSLYGTDRTFGTNQTNAIVGDRFGKFSMWLSGNFQNSNSQPLTYVTAGTFPTGTTGGFADTNKAGAAANVLGASGLLHTQMANAKAKLAYDITPTLRATYTFGYWQNDANAGIDSYLDRSGAPSFGGQAGFASGNYALYQMHQSHSLSLRSDTRKDWDYEVVGAAYRIIHDQQRTPTGVASDTGFNSAGRVAVLDGTGWATLDAKASWHPGGPVAMNTLSFGVHGEHYNLLNPTYNTTDWHGGALGTIASEGDGKTETRALWVQDAWIITPTTRLTVGGRYEWWKGFDGLNINGSTRVEQPSLKFSRFSPKAAVTWSPENWDVTASVAKAYRFATPAELYQLVTTGVTFTSPDPNLKPDNDLAAELRIERNFMKAKAQVSFFQDDVHDAIISQFLPLVQGSSTLYSYLSNVDHVRARGVELAMSENGMLVKNLELTGSATYVDARTLALSGRASATAPEGSAVGKFLPNIPKWRASFTGTYRSSQKSSISLGGRYSDKLWTTLDNSDVRFNTYQGFDGWFVMDARASYKLTRNWAASLGIDNLLDRKYFLFHPFPQRTFVGSAKFTL